MMDKTIVRNAVKCSNCGEEIESKYAHDFKRCKCGRVSIDGGNKDLNRIFKFNESDYAELSEVKE